MPAALILVDLQNDFLPGGTLAVSEGDAVIPVANVLAARFDLVVATQDWHPANHESFRSVWPVHCVQGTHGAAFAPGLNLDAVTAVFPKGTNPEIDSYSGFQDNEGGGSTGLAQWLRTRGVTDVYVMGLATDYCVMATALDAVREGFTAHLVVDGCRGVDLAPGDCERALATMRAAGVRVTTSGAL